MHACLLWGVSHRHTTMFQVVFLHAGVLVDGWKRERWLYVKPTCRKLQQHDGAPSTLPSLPRPSCTRPDRHLRQLSRRRLTNWLLNYWATWPVIASYLTSSPLYPGSWILRFARRVQAHIPPSCALPSYKMTTRNTALIVKSPSVMGPAETSPFDASRIYLDSMSAWICDIHDINISLHTICFPPFFAIYSPCDIFMTFS